MANVNKVTISSNTPTTSIKEESLGKDQGSFDYRNVKSAKSEHSFVLSPQSMSLHELQKNGKDNPDDVSCGVCLETLINTGAVTNTGCHPLHEECKKDWYNACIEGGQLTTCPVCRQVPTKDIIYENFDMLVAREKTNICKNSDCIFTIKEESISKNLTECPYPLSLLDSSDPSNFMENNHPILIPALEMMLSGLNITIKNIYYTDKHLSYSNLSHLNKRNGQPAIEVETFFGFGLFYSAVELNTKKTVKESWDTLLIDYSCDVILCKLRSLYEKTLFAKDTSCYIHTWDYFDTNSLILSVKGEKYNLIGLSSFLNIKNKQFYFDKFNEAVITQFGSEVLENLYSSRSSRLHDEERDQCGTSSSDYRTPEACPVEHELFESEINQHNSSFSSESSSDDEDNRIFESESVEYTRPERETNQQIPTGSLNLL